MVKHYGLTLTTGTQQLSAVLPDYSATGAPAESWIDRTWRHIWVTANTANTGAAYLGGYGTKIVGDATGSWGLYVPAPSSSVPAAPIDLGPSRLSDWAALGVANEILRIAVED